MKAQKMLVYLLLAIGFVLCIRKILIEGASQILPQLMIIIIVLFIVIVRIRRRGRY